SESLLEHLATARPSHGQRLQSSTGRLARERNDQRRDRRIAGLHAGTDLARRESAGVTKRRKPEVARGRGSVNDHGLGRGRRLSSGVRRSKRPDFAGSLSGRFSRRDQLSPAGLTNGFSAELVPNERVFGNRSCYNFHNSWPFLLDRKST